MSQEDFDETKLGWFQDRIMNWGNEHLRTFPWRETRDPYAILVAEFLLQQTDAPRIISAYHLILKKYPTLQALADASVQEITNIFKPIGLYYRGYRLSQIARAIVEDPACKGEIPNEETKLLQFKGIGRYIAGSICANAFNQPTAVLDTNVARILQRFFGLVPNRKRPRDDPYFWEIAQRIAPSTNIGLWNLILIDFGAAICTFRNPRCSECPLQQKCKYINLIKAK